MKDEKHNGWTNYATWRVNLELFNGRSWDEEHFEDVSSLASFLEEEADEYVIGKGEGVAYNYAAAFLKEVNWYEIAESIVEENTDIIKK